MGAAISNNVSSQIVNTSYGIANTYVTDCSSAAKSTYEILASKGCNQTLKNVDLKSGTTINVDCIQNNTTKNSMQSMIQDQVVAQATAAAQSIGGPSLSFANSIQDIAQNIAQNIKNDYTQRCVQNNTTKITIDCTDPSTNQSIDGLTIDNSIADYATCTSNNTTVNLFQSKLSTLIRTQTNASEVNTFGSFVAIFVIIIAIVGFFFVKTLSGPMGWVIVIIVAAIVLGLIIYAGFAFENSLYPFTKTR